ncbi:phage integrase family protein [Paraburkholderia sp. BR10872]|uniref:phage integrase family protein n=1 Tax=Paraburkholderia sp. BR10872 TaxID=3236989 RepID=UPI0034D18E43
MAQHTRVADAPRRYTRTDFTALRFRLNRMPAANIIDHVYGEHELAARGIGRPHELEAWLDGMRDHLVERVSLSNPLLSKTLADARTYNRWSRAAIDFLVKAADQDVSRPVPADSVSAWLKPVAFQPLRLEGIQTLGDLTAYINARGPGWFRGVTRIGAGKARSIERWLAGHAGTLGALRLEAEPVRGDLVELAPDTGTHADGADHANPLVPLVPLERLRSIATALDGHTGLNRAHGFCLISARNDLDAVRAYLYRFRERPKTHRAYQKELERFLLWCVRERRIALSSIGTDECEAYKDFLGDLPGAWTGPRAPRTSSRWRPFAGALLPVSQRYAIQALRSFFDWLVNVRYLGGNPWHTVDDPPVDQRETPMAIEKAIPDALWTALTCPDGIFERVCARLPSPRSGSDTRPMRPWEAGTLAVQLRVARAAVMLIGFSGMRREEAARVTRDRCRPVPETADQTEPLWEIAVLGKRRKWRTVFVPARVIAALRAHWHDRGLDFDAPEGAHHALLSPVVVAAQTDAEARQIERDLIGDPSLTGIGFAPDNLYRVVVTALARIAGDATLDLGEAERTLLRTAPHALRHTFASGLAAKGVPVDVLQRLLGHLSIQTTTIYVRAERTRSIQELARIYGG